LDDDRPINFALVALDAKPILARLRHLHGLGLSLGFGGGSGLSLSSRGSAGAAEAGPLRVRQ
jgi:hypothetical protein